MMRATMSKKVQYEKFKVRRKMSFVETLLWSVESIIYIVGAFYAGFQLRTTNNLLFVVMLFIILVIRFKWKTIEETTKKVRLI
jgi:hypothetical protein